MTTKDFEDSPSNKYYSVDQSAKIWPQTHDLPFTIQITYLALTFYSSLYKSLEVETNKYYNKYIITMLCVHESIHKCGYSAFIFHKCKYEQKSCCISMHINTEYGLFECHLIEILWINIK